MECTEQSERTQGKLILPMLSRGSVDAAHQKLKIFESIFTPQVSRFSIRGLSRFLTCLGPTTKDEFQGILLEEDCMKKDFFCFTRRSKIEKIFSRASILSIPALYLQCRSIPPSATAIFLGWNEEEVEWLINFWNQFLRINVRHWAFLCSHQTRSQKIYRLRLSRKLSKHARATTPAYLVVDKPFVALRELSSCSIRDSLIIFHLRHSNDLFEPLCQQLLDKFPNVLFVVSPSAVPRAAS